MNFELFFCQLQLTALPLSVTLLCIVQFINTLIYYKFKWTYSNKWLSGTGRKGPEASEGPLSHNLFVEAMYISHCRIKKSPEKLKNYSKHSLDIMTPLW